jgi:hypothetical protein
MRRLALAFSGNCSRLKQVDTSTRSGWAVSYRRLGGVLNYDMCPLLAQSGHYVRGSECPLLGVKRTLRLHCEMSAFDPKRTSGPAIGPQSNSIST